MITKAVFDSSQNGLRKGASRFVCVYHFRLGFLTGILLLELIENANAVLFFAICTTFELICVLLYAFVFPKLPIVKYYRAKAASGGSKTVSAGLAAAGIHSQSVKLLNYPLFLKI